ncbi:hypothetical protein BH11PSE2_BH11PSE2_01080 [soil metagenome]
MTIKPNTVIIGLAATACAAAMALAASAQAPTASPVPGPTSGPTYTADGKMNFPADYREWIYLSSGLDMTYGPAMAPPGQHRFDNVFVDPVAYRAFKATGSWPDKTVMVLEVRKTESKGSVNTAGQYQADVVATEVHVKDKARFKSGWGFFPFNSTAPARVLPETVACYSCHQDHGSVDTTFVQFYPTLRPIAQKAGTYREDPPAKP